MKKTVCVLLAALLALSLCGCGKTPGPAAPEEETQDSPAGEGIVFSLPELPEIGEYYDGEKIDYFFENGVPDTFTPRDDYGPLTLYFADVTYYRCITDESEEWDGSEYMCAYGLMTRDGRIVTGAQWTDGYMMGSYETGGCYFLNRTLPGDEYDNKYTTDVIGLDGSWAMHFDGYVNVYNLFGFGQPYFIIWDDTQSAVYSSADGTQVFSLRDYMIHVPDSDYAYMLPVVFADEDFLLLQTKNDYENEASLNAYTAVDWNGNVLFETELTNRDLYWIGGRLIRNAAFFSSERFRLFDPMCEPLSDRDYRSVTVDKNTGITLAVYGSGSSAGKDYFDADGNAVFPDTGWTAQTLRLLDDYYFWEGSNGTVLCDKKDRVFYDFYGNEIPLPVPAAYVTIMFTDENNDLLLYMRGEDGFGYLLAPDGEVLMKIDAPYEFQYTRDSERYITLDYAFGRATAVHEDGSVKIYDVAAGKEIYAGTLEDFFAPGTDVEAYRQNCSLWLVSSGLLCARQDSRMTVYGLPELRVKYSSVVNERTENGIVLIATPAECIALDETGNVLFRAANGKMA